MSTKERPSHLAGHEQEIREGKTIGAMALLEEKIIPDLHKDDPNYQIPKKLKEKLDAIQSKGTQFVPNKPGALEEVFLITYNTQSGQIGYPEEAYQIGEFSRFAVTLAKQGEKTVLNEASGRWEKIKGVYEFQLFRPGFAPSIAEVSEALMTDAGEKSPSQTLPNRWIQPERIVPGQSDLVGIHEIPGQSQFPVSTAGDFIIINALRQFNRKYSGRDQRDNPSRVS